MGNRHGYSLGPICIKSDEEAAKNGRVGRHWGFAGGGRVFARLIRLFYLIRNTFVRSSVKASNMIYFVFPNAAFIIVVLI
jgi:hypothetical protein